MEYPQRLFYKSMSVNTIVRFSVMSSPWVFSWGDWIMKIIKYFAFYFWVLDLSEYFVHQLYWKYYSSQTEFIQTENFQQITLLILIISFYYSILICCLPYHYTKIIIWVLMTLVHPIFRCRNDLYFVRRGPNEMPSSGW